MFPLESVDRVEIQVLIDNVTDSLSSVPAFVDKEWSVLQENGLSVIAGDSLCCANHGLSLLITTHCGETKHSVLFDAGPADYAVERNGVRLGLAFEEVEAVVLSHGHWDHAGGIPQALRFIRQKHDRKPVPLYMHPGMFRQRGTRQSDGSVLPMQRVPRPDEWETLGAAPEVSSDPSLCLDGSFFISGEIPRVTPYENGFPGHVAKDEETGEWVKDELLMDERFMALRVKNKGLVLFSACSHAGIVNVLHESVRTFPGIPILAIIGGFHLAGTNERIISETVADLKQFDAIHIIPAHCTGWRAVNALLAEFGESVVVPAAVGKRFRL